MSGGDEGFFARVYALVRRVPRGRVVTYGQVASLLGVPRGARAVGWALRALPEAQAARVPWHRVVGTGGRISPRRGPGPEIQRRRLRAEKVAFRGSCVDMHRHGLLSGPVVGLLRPCNEDAALTDSSQSSTGPTIGEWLRSGLFMRTTKATS